MHLSTILTVFAGVATVNAVKFTLNTFQDVACSLTTGNYNLPQSSAGQCVSFEGPATSITFSSSGPNRRKCHLNVYLGSGCSGAPNIKSRKANEGQCVPATDFDASSFRSAKVVCAKPAA